MSNTLYDSFSSFASLTKSKLQHPKDQGSRASVPLVPDEIILPLLVDELERHDSFRQLAEQTRSEFADDYHADVAVEAWQDFIHNFLCQSGYYFNVLEGKPVNVEETFSTYCEAFERRTTHTTYLAPMQFVSFDDDLIDFGQFQVVRFSVDELRKILRIRDRRVFYPSTIPQPEMIEFLSNYWFVRIDTQTNAQRLGVYLLEQSPSDRLLFSGHAERVFTDFAKPVDRALRELCLFDWARSKMIRASKAKASSSKALGAKGRELWWRFDIPFVIEIEDQLFFEPSSIPDLTILKTDPESDPEDGIRIPSIRIRLDRTETNRFKDFIQSNRQIFDRLTLDTGKWEFMGTALGYYTKAFFAPPGIEQLLWDIAAMEALLGEKGAGVTRRLADRISAILGKTPEQRRAISERFAELYSIRNALVHGTQFKKQTLASHLLAAHKFSRQAILWFLKALNTVRSSNLVLNDDKYFPTREHVLTLIEFDYNDRLHIHRLIDTLPKEFPFVQEWLDYGDA